MAKESARQHVVAACGQVRQQSIPVACVIRKLSLSERTTRRWRSNQPPASGRCGRPAKPATIAQRNAAKQFLSQGGPGMPLYALRRAFPTIRRADLQDVHRRFRRIHQRRRLRRQSRLDWRSPGTVWAADFKERREPLEGRFGWILSIKDLASRYQLAWLPLEQANAAAVQAEYARLFGEHGPPLVMKSDNGGPFRDECTKALLAEYQVTPLYNPVRRPSYNGGVERANGQLAGYQEAQAEQHGRPGLPTCADAESARRLANDVARRDGFRGPAACEIWAARLPVATTARAAFLTTVRQRRADVRAQWNFASQETLTHYQQAAVDRRAVRDAMVSHDLLRILPRHSRRTSAPNAGREDNPPDDTANAQCSAEKNALAMLSSKRPGRIELFDVATPMVDAATDSASAPAGRVHLSPEEAHSSNDKTSASGQHYG